MAGNSVTFKKLRVKRSNILEYSPYNTYAIGDICLCGKRLYISIANENINNSPILGIMWDQLI